MSAVEQDLAASLRITATQVTRARAHLLARLQDTDETGRRHLAEAANCVEAKLLEAGARHLRQAATEGAVHAELARVLELLR